MKVALTLRDFLDTYLDNACSYIIVSTTHNIVFSDTIYNYITPTHHAWSNNSKECLDEWDKLESAGKISKKARALSFTNKDFDVDKLYGEYADWLVESFEPACFINPFTNELDEDCFEIFICKEPDEKFVPFTYKEKENKNDL